MSTAASFSESPPPLPSQIDRIVYGFVRHWLRYVNILVLLYAGLPWLAPLAKAFNVPLVNEIIFFVYRFFCHQLPDRSFTLYGHQVAFCQRETAMYTTLLVLGLLFPLVRKRLPPAPIWLGALLLLPLALDGLTHMLDDILAIDLRGSDAIGTPNFWLRMITGVLFGIAVAVTMYPRIERDLHAEAQRLRTRFPSLA